MTMIIQAINFMWRHRRQLSVLNLFNVKRCVRETQDAFVNIDCASIHQVTSLSQVQETNNPIHSRVTNHLGTNKLQTTPRRFGHQTLALTTDPLHVT